MYLRGEINYKKWLRPRFWRQTKNVSIYFTKAAQAFPDLSSVYTPTALRLTSL